MAKLDVMPQRHIISKFKGLVDFYEYKGIPVARSWPYYPPRKPYPAEAEAQQHFAEINHALMSADANTREALEAMAAGIPLTWRDIGVMLYISGIPPGPPPP